MTSSDEIAAASVSDTAYHNAQILPLARNVMVQAGLQAPSVADVGCYKRPVHGFVSKLFPDVSFLGVDEDQDAIDWLRENGMQGADFQTYLDQDPHDFAFLMEVIEHIRPEDSQGFLGAVLKQTKTAAFLTTPNFEGWDAGPRDKLAQRAELREMRYVPDHLKAFNAASPNPHHHKQVITRLGLAKDIAAVLPDGWAFRVFPAWPWTMMDHARNVQFDHCFKVFAIMWNTTVFDRDIGQLLDDQWLPKTPGAK